MIEGLIIFSFLGMFVGLIAGMFGIGGGTLIVPVLIASFLSYGFEETIIIHLAIGSSMASIFFTGIASAYAHKKKDAIDFDLRNIFNKSDINSFGFKYIGIGVKS